MKNNIFKILCLTSFLSVSITFLYLEYKVSFKQETVKDYAQKNEPVSVYGLYGYILYQSSEMYYIRYQNTNGDLRRGMFYRWEFVGDSVGKWDKMVKSYRQLQKY